MIGEKNVKKYFDTEKIMQSEQRFIDYYTEGKKGPIRMLFKFYKGYYVKLLWAVFFFIIKSSPTWILPIITADVINIVLDRPADYVKKLIIYFVVAMILLLQNIPFHTIYIKFFSTATRNVEAGLRGAMVRKLQHLSINFHNEMESGKIQSKVMRDVEAVADLSSNLFNTGVSVGVNMTISLIVVITKNIYVFLMFIFCIPLAVILRNSFKGIMKKQSHEFRSNVELTASAVYDMEELIPITRAHALENREIKKVTGNITKVAKSGYRFDFIQNLFGSANWCIFLMFQTICLFFTVILALKGKITVGEISLYQSYFGSLTGQVSAIIGMLPLISKGAESINSIGEIMAAGDVEDNKDKIKIKDLKGEYDFKDVYFNYDGDSHVLKGLNLKVNQGETIALVGESGSGKSTILNLVTGFNKAQKGTVTIDGININDLDLHSYRKFISIVPQSSILFSGSIKDNITYGCSHISDEFLDYVIKSARLDKVISKMPHGIDTLVGERGAKLSGGQRQRISIARAIIRDPKVIIFDEATSALDSVTEREIQEAVDNLTADRTTFIVAHRLSTIRNADKIAVIDAGKCVEYGTYKELMDLKGEFYKFKQNQS